MHERSVMVHTLRQFDPKSIQVVFCGLVEATNHVFELLHINVITMFLSIGFASCTS